MDVRVGPYRRLGPKYWCFWILVLEKTLESPLDCKEIKPVNPKGNQSWIFIGRTYAEATILWHLMQSRLIEKTFREDFLEGATVLLWLKGCERVSAERGLGWSSLGHDMCKIYGCLRVGMFRECWHRVHGRIVERLGWKKAGRGQTKQVLFSCKI